MTSKDSPQTSTILPFRLRSISTGIHRHCKGHHDNSNRNQLWHIKQPLTVLTVTCHRSYQLVRSPSKHTPIKHAYKTHSDEPPTLACMWPDTECLASGTGIPSLAVSVLKIDSLKLYAGITFDSPCEIIIRIIIILTGQRYSGDSRRIIFCY